MGGFYKPPNCTINYFDLMKESIDRACNTSISDIIITGDFNFNMAQNALNKMSELILEYNLTQLISEPTHVTEHSSSILDLILVRNKNNVLLSGVADPFIPNQIRYHSPVIVLLKFTRPITRSFKRRVWYFKLADYEKYRLELSERNIYEKTQLTSNIDQNIKDITEAIMQAADKSIPNKIVTIKPSDHPWITCHIKNMIRKRKRTFRQFKKTNINHYWLKYKTIPNNVVKEIRQSKQQYFDKLDQLLSSENIDPKLFWKTSKQLLNLNKASGSIQTLKLNSNIAENDKQKAELLNHYFTSQTMVDDANKELPHIDPSNHTLDSIIILCQDVKDVLLHLNVTKASGPDLISPRLLREGPIFLHFLILLSSIAHLIKDTFPLLGKNLMSLLFTKRMIKHCQVTVDRYLS